MTAKNISAALKHISGLSMSHLVNINRENITDPMAPILYTANSNPNASKRKALTSSVITPSHSSQIVLI